MRHLHPARALAGAVILAVAAAGAIAPVASAKRAGAVYTETNGTSANAVVVFDRKANGKLTQRQIVKTGGKGGAQAQPGCTPPGGCPILDADSEVNVSPNGRLVFAVNAGSNSVTSFRETSTGLKRVDRKPSGGTFPTSVTSAGNLLYVLNQNSGSISGFHFSSDGHLHAIAGSSQALSANPPVGFGARQIGFDRTGRLLVVSVLGASVIDTFVLNPSDQPLPATAFPSTTPLPFGFAFDIRNRLVMSQLTNPMATGDTAVYDVSSAGSHAPNNTQPSQGAAPCWVAITKNGRYVFVVNTGGGAPATITRYALENNGTLTFLGLTPPNGNEFARTDEVLSRDSKYLYVLVPSVAKGNTSHIDEYRVGSNGDLTLIGATPQTLAVGVSGLDGR
jgi:6-phosphogluconolactonase (cycloisomerase 2 family)